MEQRECYKLNYFIQPIKDGEKKPNKSGHYKVVAKWHSNLCNGIVEYISCKGWKVGDNYYTVISFVEN